MGERALKNRVEKLMEIKAQMKALEEQAGQLETEIKEGLQSRGQDEMKIGDYMIRFKTIVTNRFDTKAFQKDHKKLYEMYLKPAATKRFTIA